MLQILLKNSKVAPLLSALITILTNIQILISDKISQIIHNANEKFSFCEPNLIAIILTSFFNQT